MSRTKTFQNDDLGKGLNQFTRDTMIKESESSTAWNVWATGKNSIKKRPGIVELCTVAGGNPITGLGTYYSGATRSLVAISNGVPYTVETGSAVAMSAVPASAGAFTAGLKHDFCQAAGKLFTANGTDKIRYFDGAWRENTANSVEAKWLLYYKNCLWAAGNTTYPTRLYRSGSDTNVGNFTYNITGNPLATSVYVSKDDGQDMKGMYKFQDLIYPAKERSLWRASVGTDEFGLITLEMVDASRGCDSHFSIDSVDNDNFMFSEQGVLATGYEPNILDQIRTNIISLRVEDEIKNIQKSNIPDICAIYSDNHYYLSYASGGSTYNNRMLVYDRQRLSWWIFSISGTGGAAIGANCFTEFKDSNGETKLYFGSPVDGKIYYFDEATKQDSGYTIVTDWKTGKLSFKNYAQSKFFLDVLLYIGKTPGALTVTIYVDGTVAATKDYSVGNTGFAGIGIETIGTEMIGVGGGGLTISDSGGSDIIRIPINKIGRNIQIEVESNESTGGWEANAYQVDYRPISDLYQPGTL